MFFRQFKQFRQFRQFRQFTTTKRYCTIIRPNFVAPGNSSGTLPATGEFLRLEPGNLIMTALKKYEDDDSISLRFYEAEGRANEPAHIKLFRPIKQAWKTNLIEEEPEPSLSTPTAR